MACYRVYKDGHEFTLHRVSVGIETSRASVIFDRDEANLGPRMSRMLGFVDGVDGVVRLPEHETCVSTDEAAFDTMMQTVLGPQS